MIIKKNLKCYPTTTTPTTASTSTNNYQLLTSQPQSGKAEESADGTVNTSQQASSRQGLSGSDIHENNEDILIERSIDKIQLGLFA